VQRAADKLELKTRESPEATALNRNLAGVVELIRKRTAMTNLLFLPRSLLRFLAIAPLCLRKARLDRDQK
jgi:hypothetical protein